MFPRSLVATLAVPALLALPIQSIPRADARPSFFVGGGATATLDGFRGGWGISSGLGLPLAPSADFLVRADYHAVPGERPHDIWISADGPFGAWPQGVPRASLESLMLGLRLHPSTGQLRVYLDAQVGVGHGPDRKEIRDTYGYVAQRKQVEANAALGFGSGIQVRLPAVGSLFADAHYDFLFLEGVPSPVIPVRVGLGLP